MNAFFSWFASHVAGGLLTAVLVGGGHLVLQRRHLQKVTDAQTSRLLDSTKEDGEAKP